MQGAGGEGGTEKPVRFENSGFVVVCLADGRKILCNARQYLDLTAKDLEGAQVRLLK